MRKSSIYLPDDLKAALAALAVRSGRSEADLIRAAIDRLVSGDGDPAGDTTASAPLPFPRPALVGVGVGPGDPVLATELARRTLAAADRLLVATTDAHAVGRAEMVARAIAPTVRATRVPFSIGADDAARASSFDRLVDAVLAGTDAGELVALAVLGDPSQWTIFPPLAGAVRRERPGLPVHAVAGITSYQALAAGGAASLGGPDGSLAVVDGVAALDAALDDPATTAVLYKASTDAGAVRAVAERHGRHGTVGELAGLPGARTVGLDALGAGPLPYLSTVLFEAVPSGLAR